MSLHSAVSFSCLIDLRKGRKLKMQKARQKADHVKVDFLLGCIAPLPLYLLLKISHSVFHESPSVSCRGVEKREEEKCKNKRPTTFSSSFRTPTFSPVNPYRLSSEFVLFICVTRGRGKSSPRTQRRQITILPFSFFCVSHDLSTGSRCSRGGDMVLPGHVSAYYLT